jgi:hypothetical protein
MKLLLALVFFIIGSAQMATSQAAEIKTFEMPNGQQVISIRGRLEVKDIYSFEKTADELHFNKRIDNKNIIVQLDSHGGNVEALSIGYLIWGRRMQTYVADNATCYSTCAYIWLAGDTRWIGKHASIGFHMAHAAPGEKTTAEDYMAVNAHIAMYFGMLGLPPNFLEWVLSAGTGIKILDDAMAAKFGIESSIAGDEFAASALRGSLLPTPMFPPGAFGSPQGTPLHENSAVQSAAPIGPPTDRLR